MKKTKFVTQNIKILKKIADFVRFDGCFMYYLIFYSSFYFFGNYFMFKNFLNVLNLEQNEAQNLFFENERNTIIFFIFDIILSPWVLYLIFSFYTDTAVKYRVFLIKKRFINFLSKKNFKHIIKQSIFGFFYVQAGFLENKLFFCIWTLYFFIDAFIKGYKTCWKLWVLHIQARDKVYYKKLNLAQKFWLWVSVVFLLIWTFYCSNVSRIAINFWKFNILVCIAIWINYGDLQFMFFTSFFCYFFYVIPQIILLWLLPDGKPIGLIFLYTFCHKNIKSNFFWFLFGTNLIVIKNTFERENLTFKSVGLIFTIIFLRVFFIPIIFKLFINFFLSYS